LHDGRATTHLLAIELAHPVSLPFGAANYQKALQLNLAQG
jgi:hypothetical protein